MAIQPDNQLVPLFGVEVIEAPAPSYAGADRLREWSKAFDQWLAELPSPNTRRAYERAWRDLLDFTGKLPWTVQSADVRDWLQDLTERPLAEPVAKGLIRKGRRSDRYGYSPATISQYLAGVSSFYTFSMERYLIVEPDGRERALHNGVNPARAVRRPKTSPFGKADYLDAQAMTALLHAIPQNTVQGLRDVALILGFMLTGRRNSEWRELQWGHLERRGDKVLHRWSGKGKEDQLHELAPPVWEAIQAYLKAAGRLDSIQDDDYVFTPLSDVATRLPQVSQLAWTRNRPLSLGHVNALLKRYARRAELDPARLTIHTLRHSFAMLLHTLGVDVLIISKRLAHSNLNITQIYIDHMRGVEDHTWRQAAAALKLDLL